MPSLAQELSNVPSNEKVEPPAPSDPKPFPQNSNSPSYLVSKDYAADPAKTGTPVPVAEYDSSASDASSTASSLPSAQRRAYEADKALERLAFAQLGPQWALVYNTSAPGETFKHEEQNTQILDRTCIPALDARDEFPAPKPFRRGLTRQVSQMVRADAAAVAGCDESRLALGKVERGVHDFHRVQEAGLGTAGEVVRGADALELVLEGMREMGAGPAPWTEHKRRQYGFPDEFGGGAEWEREKHVRNGWDTAVDHRYRTKEEIERWIEGTLDLSQEGDSRDIAEHQKTMHALASDYRLVADELKNLTAWASEGRSYDDDQIWLDGGGFKVKLRGTLRSADRWLRIYSGPAKEELVGLLFLLLSIALFAEYIFHPVTRYVRRNRLKKRAAAKQSAVVDRTMKWKQIAAMLSRKEKARQMDSPTRKRFKNMARGRKKCVAYRGIAKEETLNEVDAWWKKREEMISGREQWGPGRIFAQVREH